MSEAATVRDDEHTQAIDELSSFTGQVCVSKKRSELGLSNMELQTQMWTGLDK